MTTFQRIIKYGAIALAVLLAVGIVVGILHIAGLFNGFFGDSMVLTTTKTYTVSDAVTSLQIEVGAADFTIKQGDTFSVESNLKYLTVKEQNGTLLIQEDTKPTFGATYTNAMLTVYVPANTVFENIRIKTGAGRLTANTLSAAKLSLELGAGEATFRSLVATDSVDINGGAGKIVIHGGSLRDLDLNMGVGQLDLTAALTGDCTLDLGVGESDLTLIGSKTDYTVDIQKGLGAVTVNDSPVTDFGSFGNGENRINIHGGVGAIHVSFQERIA